MRVSHLPSGRVFTKISAFLRLKPLPISARLAGDGVLTGDKDPRQWLPMRILLLIMLLFRLGSVKSVSRIHPA